MVIDEKIFELILKLFITALQSTNGRPIACLANHARSSWYCYSIYYRLYFINEMDRWRYGMDKFRCRYCFTYNM